MEGPVFGVICVLIGALVWQYRTRMWQLQKQEEDEALRKKRLRRKEREAEEEDLSEAITVDLPQMKRKK